MAARSLAFRAGGFSSRFSTNRLSRSERTILSGLLGLTLVTAGQRLLVWAQPQRSRTAEQLWPYPIAYDSITAAPNNYKLLFEDGKMRFIEVTIRPRETTPVHGDPYPTVFVYNSISGDPSLVTETYLDPNSPLDGQGMGHSGPPKLYGFTAPTCATVGPQGPHRIHNGGTVPVHYYRVEYKRIDGDALTANWRKWYPWMQYMQFVQSPFGYKAE